MCYTNNFLVMFFLVWNYVRRRPPDDSLKSSIYFVVRMHHNGFLRSAVKKSLNLTVNFSSGIFSDLHNVI